MDQAYGIMLYVFSLLTMGGIYAVLCLGLNVQWGFTGLFNAGIAGFFVVGGATGLWVARLIGAHDVRHVIIGGAVIAGGALAVLGQVEQQWQMYLVYAVFAVGFAACGLVPATTVVTRWFHVRRSVALSVASTGLSVGGIVLTPLAKRLSTGRGEVTPNHPATLIV